MSKIRLLAFLAFLCICIIPINASAAVLFNQTEAITVTRGFTSQNDNPDGAAANQSTYIADDFVNAAPWQISSIFIPGAFWANTSFITVTNLTWAIYADNAGVPAGYPELGPAPYWTLTLPPADGQIDYSTGSDGNESNVTLNLSTPVTIPVPTAPATCWWLVFYPEASYGPTYEATGWGRRASDDVTNTRVALKINPGGGWDWGQPPYVPSVNSWIDWRTPSGSWGDISNPQNNLTKINTAFRLEGTILTSPAITVTPTALNFGQLLLDSADVTQTVTISNTGTANLNFTAFNVTGANFADGGGTCLVGTPVAPGNSCTKGVRFTPATLGANSGNLQILSNALETNVALTATVGAPGIIVSPSALGFGNIAVGLTSTFQTVTITNTGTFSLNITSDITGTSDNMFAIAAGGTCSSPTDTLTASEVCTLRVTFTPTENGLQTAILEIVSTDPVSPTVQVALSGTGVYEATPSALEGTYGSQIQYGGAPGGFGDKKGKVYINGVKQKVESWVSTQIEIIVNKVKDLLIDEPYDVSIQWKPKGSKTTEIIDLPGAFTLRRPELDALSYHGSPDTEVTVTGMWFGTKKGKVIVNDEKCKVTNWSMNPTTGVSTLTFVVHKKLLAGNWFIDVENKIGIARAAFIVD